MSIFTTITSLFGSVAKKAETVAQVAMSDIKAGFQTVDNLAGNVLGQAEKATAIVALVDQPLAETIETGITACKTLKADLESGIDAAEPNVTQLGQQLMQLFAGLGTLAAQAGPFIDVAAKDVKAVDSSAVAAVKALPAIPTTI